MRTYSDHDLERAVRTSTSWRGVLRVLGIRSASSGAMRSVRGHVDRLGLDHSHFRGGRGWSEDRLRGAVAQSSTWTEVIALLGTSGSSSSLRGHAARLGLDTSHLDAAAPAHPPHATSRPDQSNLRRAGSMLAAAWFEMSGHQVSWPLEPCSYDLVAWLPGGPSRVQVKTTTVRVGSTWKVRLTRSRREIRAYAPDEIDHFFVVDGDLAFYLVPVATVGGLTHLHLSAYEHYRLAPLALHP